MAKAPSNSLIPGSGNSDVGNSISLNPAAATSSTNPTSSTSELALEVTGVGALLGLPIGKLSVSDAIVQMSKLSTQANAGNTEAKQNLEQLQTLLYDGGFYKGQTNTKPKLGVVTTSDLNAFKNALIGAASSGATLSDFLQQTATGAGGSGSTVLQAPKVEQTVYSAADIQATADATAKTLIGRVLNAQEMQGVLGVMNSASGAKASADANAALAQQQSDVSTQQAVYGTGANTAAPGVGGAGKASAQQVYDQVLSDGGSVTQAGVAAAFVSGVESDGDPTELAGGVGPAQGLFQFEPGTWTSAVKDAGGGLPAKVGDATWQQQVQAFVAHTKGDHFGDWGPDMVANPGDPNSPSNPAYGYGGAPQQGSKVGNFLAANASALAAGSGGAAGTAPSAPTISNVGASGAQGATTDIFQNPVITDVPATPDASEATTNYIETQMSPQYQANNLLNIFQMIEGKLGTSPAPSINPSVRSTPIAMKG